MVIAAGMTVGSPHLVAQGSGAETPMPRISNRPSKKSRWASAPCRCRWRPDRAVLPLSRSAAAAGPDRLSRHAQYRDVLDRHRHLRLQDPQAGGRHQIGDDQAGKERQGHRPDARFPDRRPAEAMPELLAQLKAGGYKIVHMVPKAAGDDAAEIRRHGQSQGQVLAAQQHAAGIERRQDDQRMTHSLQRAEAIRAL